MAHQKRSRKTNLLEKYPPSPPCSCTICLSYCIRPGWWTVAEAANAIRAGYAARMMLEIAPELTFGVLSPAFKGCETGFATNECAANGCTFLNGEKCELHGTGYQPLECRYCHHTRVGQGLQCHTDLENDWHSPQGQRLIWQWCAITRFAERYDFTGLDWLNPIPSGNPHN